MMLRTALAAGAALVTISIAMPSAAARGRQAAPLACRPDAFDATEAARYEELFDALRGAVAESRELRDGWAYRLPADPALFVKAAEWITLERRCCDFFRFELEWAGAETPIWLRVRGGREAKALLADAWEESGPLVAPAR